MPVLPIPRDPRAHLWGPAAHQQLGHALHQLGVPQAVVDLGCGDGAMLRLLDRHLPRKVSYLGLDLEDQALARGRALASDVSRRCRFERLDIAEEPLETASIQGLLRQTDTLLVAQATLGHMATPAAMLGRWVRALRHPCRVILVEHDHMRRIRERPDRPTEELHTYRDTAAAYQHAMCLGTKAAGAGEPDLGSRLTELLNKAGLACLGAVSLAEALPSSPPSTEGAWTPEQEPVAADRGSWSPLALRGGISQDGEISFWELEQRARALRRGTTGAPVAFGALNIAWAASSAKVV